jgi:VWFA-related protein
LKPLLRSVLLGLLTAVVVRAVPATPVQVSLQRLDVSRLPDIDLYFTVADESGKSVIGLTDREIAVLCDGAVQPVVSLQSAIRGGESLAAVLLFDRSGSMKTAVDRAKDAAAGFIRRLSVDDQIAVVSFDQTIKVDLPLTTDKAAGEAAVRAILPGENTALFDAVREGLLQTGGAATKRLALIILSDGMDTRSRATLEEAAAEAKAQGVAVFSIGLGDKVDAAKLEALAAATGGRYFAASRAEDLLILYQTIGEQLQNQYRLTFRPAFGRDEAWHQLEIRFTPPGGGISASAKRDFIASIGPGISRKTVGGFERKLAERDLVLWGGIGAAFGALLGLLLGVLLKALRPDLRLRISAFLGLLLLCALLGGLVGVILKTMG